MSPRVSDGPVPREVQIGDDVLTVDRAWPRGPREGGEMVLVEGHDSAGRLRAARLRLEPHPGLGWQVDSIRVAKPGQDPRLPGLAEAAAGGTLVVHRFGKRAVVRFPDRYVKVVRPGEGPSVATAARQGDQVAARAGFAAPAVLDSGPEAITFSVLPGRSLHELGGVATRGEWTRWWERWADQWVRLTGTSAGDQLPQHTAHDEVVNLLRWLERVERLEALPVELGQLVRTRAEAVTTDLVAQPSQELVVSHRDLHDKQMLADGGSLGLLDFDTVSLAEPALDLGNLWVHARLRADQGLWSHGHSQVVQDAVRGVASALGVSDQRFATYAEATRLRLACLYAFRPRHRALALAWAAGEPAVLV